MKRVTLFAGHYGSGKTNLALNYALSLRKRLPPEKPVAIFDLDIVNPYFRTKDSESVLREAGIRFVSSKYANTNVDVPAIPAEAYAILDNKSLHAVVDVGGDDRGALALGRYASGILAENDYEMFLVINASRPLTGDGKGALEVVREIEAAGRIPFTAIINNTNLGLETDAETVLHSQAYAHTVSELTGLPVRYTSVREDLAPSLEGKIEHLYPIQLFNKPQWVI